MKNGLAKHYKQFFVVDDKMLDLLEDDKIEASFFLIKKHADIRAIA